MDNQENKKIKIASLFSGIGGFESGLYQALGKENVEIVFSSEIDKYASKGYEIMYGHTPHGDITKIESNDIPDFDLLVGGSPCQSFSIAGKRLGLTDSRGTLFYEYARIVNDKRPKAFIYENVKGLVNHDKGNTFKGMCEIFESIGYKITYQIVNSKHHGVPQNRERIFIIGYRDHSKDYEFPKNQPLNLAIKDILEESVDEKFYLSDEQVAKFKPHQRKKQSDIKIKARAYQGVYEKERRTEYQLFDENGIAPTVSCFEANKIHIEPKIIVEGSVGNYNSTGRVFSQDGISPTIDTMQGGNRQPKIIIEGQVGDYQDQLVMNPEGISKCILSGNPKKYITEPIIEGQIGEKNFNQKNVVYGEDGVMKTITTDSRNYVSEIKCINPKKEDGTQTYQQDRIYEDDGITPALCRGLSALKIKENIVSEPYNTTRDGVSYAITTRTHACYLPQHVEKSKATLIQETNEQNQKHFRIRKLTPLECLRLQGFSDDYYFNLKEHGISNSQIYKMAGNAVTTKVIKALVEQLDFS